MKEVSDASSENDDYAVTEAAGWLKDYELPAQADKAITYTHGTVTVGKPTVDIDNPDNSKPGVAKNIPCFLPARKQKPQSGSNRRRAGVHPDNQDNRKG